MFLTVLAVADQVSPSLYDHFQPERWRNVDLVLSCGDLPPDYLDVLATRLAVPIFYVRGNHDGHFAASRYDGAENIDGRIVNFNGIHIAGFAGSMRYNDGEYQYTECEMGYRVRKSRFRALYRGRPDIVVTHAPPAGCQDGRDTAHRGFKCFQRAIEVWHPSFFVHGHVHAYDHGKSISTVGETTVINAFPYKVFEVSIPASST